MSNPDNQDIICRPHVMRDEHQYIKPSDESVITLVFRDYIKYKTHLPTTTERFQQKSMCQQTQYLSDKQVWIWYSFTNTTITMCIIVAQRSKAKKGTKTHQAQHRLRARFREMSNYKNPTQLHKEIEIMKLLLL